MPAPSPVPAPYSLSNYDVLSSVGCGNSGTVHLVRPVTLEKSNTFNRDVPCCHNGRRVAKVIPHSKLTDATRREIAIHSSLAHPNIVAFHRVTPATSTLSDHNMALAILMEYAPAGDMFTEVCSAGLLDPHTIRRRILHIATALQYLHQNHVAHLDVKLENVVLANDGSAKLIDFGCARRLDQSLPVDATLGGTVQYLPPELVATPDAPPTTAMDAWSLGVLLYTALTGNYPFNAVVSRDQDPMDDHLAEPVIRNRILHCPPHPVPSFISVPSDLQRLLSGLLQKDPANRLTIPRVLDILNESQRTSFALCNSRYQRRPPYFSRRIPQPSPVAPTNLNSVQSPSQHTSQCAHCQKQSLNTALSIFELVRSQSNDHLFFNQDKASCQHVSRRLSTSSDTSSSNLSFKTLHV